MTNNEQKFKVKINEYLITSETSPELLSEIHQLIVSAWREDDHSVADWLEQQKRAEDLNRDVFMFTASVGDKIVGVARLTLHSDIANLPEAYLFEGLEQYLPVPIASFNRLAVLGGYRNHGIATELDDYRVKKAALLGASSAVVVCREERANSLLGRGFKLLRDSQPGKSLKHIKWAVVGKTI